MKFFKNIFKRILFGKPPTDEEIAFANSGKLRISIATGTGSMYPVIQRGDQLNFIYDWDNIKPGKLVSVIKQQSPGLTSKNMKSRRRCHRVTHRHTENSWTLRGDRNRYSDFQPVWPNTYGGTLSHIFRNGERIDLD